MRLLRPPPPLYLSHALGIPTKWSCSAGNPSPANQTWALARHLPRQEIRCCDIKRSSNVDPNAKHPTRMPLILSNFLRQNDQGAVQTALFISVRRPANGNNILRSGAGQGGYSGGRNNDVMSGFHSSCCTALTLYPRRCPCCTVGFVRESFSKNGAAIVAE